MDINELVIYRSLEHQELFEEMTCLMGYASREERPDTFHCRGRLVELVVNYGFKGSLWHCLLAFYLANNRNAYTTTYEITGATGGSLDEPAREDFGTFKALFDYDTLKLEPSGMWGQLLACRPAGRGSRVFNKRIKDRIMNLIVQLGESGDVEGFQSHVTELYREFGVGKFGLNKAFHIVEKDEGQTVLIDPIINVEHVYFRGVVGYELQKQKLIESTEAFAEGREVNSVLLFGDAGTGKSSSVEAVLNEYYSRGLRITEVYKHQFKALPDVLEQVKDRNYKFIIYMDDLPFEDYKLEYKYLKAILEGELGKRPDNVPICVTSNWRHLIREKFNDEKRLGDELRNNDTVQEKLSLASRFGVTIYFDSSDKRQLETTAETLTDRYHLDMPGDGLYREADKWGLSHGDLSEHTTSQFITHLLGRQRMD